MSLCANKIYLAVLKWKYLSCIFLLSIRHFSISIKALFLPKLISNDYLTASRTQVAKMLKCCFDSRRQHILSRRVVLNKNGNAISHFYEDKLIWQSWQRNQIQTKMFITRLWKLKHSNRFNKHWPFFHMSLLYRKYCSSDLFH